MIYKVEVGYDIDVLLDAVIVVFFACFIMSSESLGCACAYKLLVRFSENVLSDFMFEFF